MSSQRAFCFVPAIPRFLTDFYVVPQFLARCGLCPIIYAPDPARETSVWWTEQSLVAETMKLLPQGVELATLPYDRSKPTLGGLLRTMRLAYRLGRKFPGCLAIFQTIIPILICGLPMRFLNVRCVFLLTGLGSIFGSDTLKIRIIRTVVKYLYRYLFAAENSRVIVHNAEDKSYLVQELGINADHIQVTGGCGVDPELFPFFEKPPNRRKKVILVPSRLLVEKGIFEAAEASKILKDRGIDHEMWFSAGIDQGNPWSLTQRDLEDIERQNTCVKFIGYHPSVVPLYEACDIVCLPTRYREGLPTALIEASACGRPIVTCNNVGCREIIVHEETGLMVPPRSPVALADALARLLHDETLAETLRQNAYRQFLAKFTKHHMLIKTVSILQGLGIEGALPNQAV
jgi:glycosyltransferase involved in cell wall biosynthesis